MMNSNSPMHNTTNGDAIDLRQAVQEQLDLILKMQEDRKGLKKQNKLLTQRLKCLDQVIKRYQVETIQIATNTDFIESSKQQNCQNKENQKQRQVSKQQKEREIKLQTIEFGIQVELQNINCSKLTEAQSLLRVLQLTQLTTIAQKLQQNQNHENQPQNNTVTKTSKKQQQPRKTNTDNASNNKQISNQIVKMSKQINALKRQLKQSQSKHKNKQKQIKQLKKCLQNKSQTLQKTRKDFNELSNLLNTDKYKSIRNLQGEIKNLKSKLIVKEENQEKIKSKKLKEVKTLLEDVTHQYSEYKDQTDKKVQVLVSELASKEKQNEQLMGEQKKLLKKLQLAAKN